MLLIHPKIGRVPLGQGPIVVLTVTDRERPREIQKAKRFGARILEVRIDRFRRLSEAYVLQKIRLLGEIGLPLIATIRSRREGGGRDVSEEKRLHLFKKILPRVGAIDLELSSTRLRKVLVPLAHRQRRRVILSYHNFRSTPPDKVLSRLILKGRKGGADLVKIAVTPKRKEDLARFLLFTHRNRNQHLISIAMGTLGAPSRAVAPLFGSLLTYTFLSRSQAPGQLSLKRLSEELNAFEEQTPLEDLRKYLKK